VTGPEELLTLARKVAEQDIDLYSDPEERQAVADATELAQAVLEQAAVLIRADRLALLVHHFVTARDEYIVAIKNCPPGNSDDYWRWQGHAEARRQFGEQYAKILSDTEAARSHTASDAD